MISHAPFAAFAICCVSTLTLLGQQAQGPLTNQRIGDLVIAGVSQNEIERIISSASVVYFDLRPISTDALLKVGVSEDIIKAMAIREMGPSTSAAISTTAAVPFNPPAPTTTRPSEPVQITSNDWTLHQGTPVRIRLMRTVSSASAQEGENVDFQTLDDISLNGVIVVPRNSTALATITIAESKKRMGRGGKLSMNIDYVRLPSGDKLPLRGLQSVKGGGHVGAMTGGIVAAAIVFWPAAPFFLFMHGKDIIIPEGHEVTVYLNSDLSVQHTKL